MRFTRRKGLVVAFALLMNLGGGPMAWAHLLGAGNSCHSPAPVHETPVDCPGHHAQAPADSAPQPQAPPCCQGGHCACATPALSLTVLSPSARLPHESPQALSTGKLPASPFENALRPPIR
jgi:hypothetical protein